MRFVLLLSFFIIIVDCQELRHTCSKGDTEWNRVLVGAHLRHWLSSIQLTGNKSPTDYLVVFKPRVKTPKDVEEHTRLDFVVKLNSIGNSIGKAWKNFGYKGPKYHDGFLYGKLDANNQMTGDDIAFIYPDFETALVGKFLNGTMMSARPTNIVAERCKGGVKQVKFAKAKANAPLLKYQRPNFLRPGDQPQACDPFERKNVHIGKGVKQDGIFARKNIRMGELICYYSGTISDPRIHPTMFQNQTSSERYSIHRNLISLGRDEHGNPLQINVPEPFWNTTNFRSTLGHKLNHSFTRAKAQYNWATHPRFGWIRTLTAIEDIYQGEEIFVHYHYPVKAGISVPTWYKELYEEEVAKWPKEDSKNAGNKVKSF